MFDLSDSIKYYKEIVNELEEYPIIKSRKQIIYYNIPCSFDIETSSFYENGEKRAIMYIWMFGINGKTYYGRSWDEYIDLLNILQTKLLISPLQRLVIYVHNLAYEFQFIRKWFNWIEVFANDSRTPIYATDENGFEYRCSLILSGMKLEKLADELLVYNVKKQVGDLNYDLVRNSATPLTKEEMGYCENDVKVVMAYIQEKLERNENIPDIPLTKTSYVRKGCKKFCYYGGKPRKLAMSTFKSYSNIMFGLTLNDKQEYFQLMRAYQGGFTHANPIIVGREFEHVKSYDFTSSYPTTLVAEKFPMSKGKRIKLSNAEEFRYYLNNYCCMFDIEVWDLEEKHVFENYLSRFKCWDVEECLDANGRVVRAKHLKTTLTEVDFDIFEHYYKWKRCRVSNFIYYKKGYLPHNLVKYILRLYKDKTELKGVNGKELEYSLAKANLNSVYGMMVTNIIRKEIVYDGEWQDSPELDVDAEIQKYNRSRNRFLFYPWGVWVTAYARRNLFTGIDEYKYDYLYSDTDSLKVLNYEKHLDYIRRYNDNIIFKLERAMLFHKFDNNFFRPKNKKGEEKILGVWDDEGVYDKFKTLGAKRYMTESNGHIKITIAGVPKENGAKFMETFENPFELFTDDLTIPPTWYDEKKDKHIDLGKLTHTYVDDSIKGEVVDYLGNKVNYFEKSFIHLEKCGYNLSMTQRYLDYVLEVKSLSY